LELGFEEFIRWERAKLSSGKGRFEIKADIKRVFIKLSRFFRQSLSALIFI